MATRTSNVQLRLDTVLSIMESLEEIPPSAWIATISAALQNSHVRTSTGRGRIPLMNEQLSEAELRDLMQRKITPEKIAERAMIVADNAAAIMVIATYANGVMSCPSLMQSAINASIASDVDRVADRILDIAFSMATKATMRLRGPRTNNTEAPKQEPRIVQ